MRIPHVEAALDCAGRHRASAALGLTAIEGERFPVPAARDEALASLHKSGVRLLQLLSRTPDSLVYDLHFVSRPSLDIGKGGSQIEVTFEIHAFGDCRDQATEKCLKHLFVLDPLLGFVWQFAEFSAIQNEPEYRRRTRPFSPASAVQVHRVSRVVSLTEPFMTNAAVPGFLPSPRPDRSSHAVRHLFPWTPAWDNWAALTAFLEGYTAPQWIRLRVANGALPNTDLGTLSATVHACEKRIAVSAPDEIALTAHLHTLRDACLLQMRRLQQSAVRGIVVVFAPGPADDMVPNLLGQSITGDLARASATSLFEGGYDASHRSVSKEMLADFSYEGESFSCDEAACYFRLPLPSYEAGSAMPIRRAHLAPFCIPTSSLANSGKVTHLGVSTRRGVVREIDVPLSHRFKHVFLIGMTGTGKSTMMLSMMLQDLRQGHGLCLIDPHGDLADDLLRRFPENRRRDLAVIDLAEGGRPVPMNLLAWSTIEERDLIIDELLSCLIRIYHDPAMFGPVFESNFRTMMKLLMGDRVRSEGPYTLLEFQLLFQNAAFRKHLLETMADDQVRDMLREGERVLYGESKPENMAPYVTSKMGRFVHDSLLRRVVGHGGMAVNIPTIMNQQKVLVVKLGRGRFGQNVADLVAAQLVLRFRVAAMQRSAIPEGSRKPFFLYVDEIGSLARDETFATLLSESRKFRLGLVLATQYASQLRDADPHRNVLAAVLGNAGTIASYRVGVEDAGLLAPAFAPAISPQDLIECPNFEGYMRVHLDSVVTRPFSFSNVPDSTPPDEGRLRRLIERSRLRHGVPAADCDERARQRRCFIEALT
jgi:hypothetical protein